MPHPPLVSVVMVAHNVEKYVGAAIDSVLAQTFPDFELIVVNDGSTDNTLSEIQSRAQKDDRIRVIHQERQGIPRVRNTACAHATGKYIAVLDSDDVALPERLAKQVQYLETHPDIALLGGQVRYFDESGFLNQKSRPATDPDEIAARLTTQNQFVHSTVMMRWESFRAVGDYRLPYAEEYDLYLRFADKHRLANLPEVLTYYRVHPQQRSITGTIGDVLMALTAQYCARVRRTTGKDPLQGIPPNDVRVLLQIGVPPSEIVAALMSLPILNADRYIANHNMEAARALLAELDRTLQLVPGSRNARSQIAWLQSCTCKARQAPVAKLRFLCRACLLNPWRIAELCAVTFNKLLNRPRPILNHER